MKKILSFLFLIAIVLLSGGNPVFAAAPVINEPNSQPFDDEGMVIFVDDEENFSITFSARSIADPYTFNPIVIEVSQGLDGIPLTFSLQPDNNNICIAPDCDLQELADYGIESVSFSQTIQAFLPPFYADGFWTLVFDAEKTEQLIEDTDPQVPLVFEVTFSNIDGSSSETFQYVLTRIYSPVIETINPHSGTIEVEEDDPFNIIITAYDIDGDILNVDAYIGFDFNDNEIFTFCADSQDIYCGNEQAFIDYGMTVEYATYIPLFDPETRHEWTLIFDPARVAIFVEETVDKILTLQLIIQDDTGLSSNENRNYQFIYSGSEDDEIVEEASPRISSRAGGGIVYGCKDERASNYNYFSSHKQSLCVYHGEAGLSQIISPSFNGGTCSFFVQKMKRGNRDGIYSNYHGEILTQVAVLQEFLKIESDGIFGPITEQAVRSFQNVNDLDPDGIVGPLTLLKLNLHCALLSSSSS